ncbi:hypothetical protein ACJX0J_029179 [Zea mays]
MLFIVYKLGGPSPIIIEKYGTKKLGITRGVLKLGATLRTETAHYCLLILTKVKSECHWEENGSGSIQQIQRERTSFVNIYLFLRFVEKGSNIIFRDHVVSKTEHYQITIYTMWLNSNQIIDLMASSLKLYLLLSLNTIEDYFGKWTQ